jgi:hypothetical protein
VGKAVVFTGHGDREMKAGWTIAIMGLLLALMAAITAKGAEVTLKLSDQEQQQLIGLLDMAAKAGGLRAAPGVTYFVQKLQTANQPPTASGAANPPTANHGTDPAKK